MRRVGRLCAWASMMTCLAQVAPAQADPILTRNQHPLVALYGLPLPLAARLPGAGSGNIGATLNWSNIATTDTTDQRSYTLDGEVFEVRLQAGHALGERFAVQGQLAWRQLSGGSLDSLVESWHDLFSLPNGSRNRLPEDALLIEYRSGESTLLRVDDESSGLADLPLAFGYQLTASDQGAVAQRGSRSRCPRARLRTSRAAVQSTSPSPWPASANCRSAGSCSGRQMWRGSARATCWRTCSRTSPGSLLAGATWNAWQSLELTAQLEANTAVLDTGTDLDGDAVVLTLGGRYQNGRRLGV